MSDDKEPLFGRWLEDRLGRCSPQTYKPMDEWPIGKIIATTIDAVEHRFRRYALLQAATILAASDEYLTASDAVNHALDLLAEIERREK